MSTLEITSAVLLLLGALVMYAAAAGVMRFPDFYARLHAAGKGDTLGQVLILLGLGLTAGLTLVSLKLALIALFLFIFNPTGTHALARGAWITGLVPWSVGEAPRTDDEDDDLGAEDHA